jgi:putative oxygen-independent coproporphyrinogen III oxidase
MISLYIHWPFCVKKCPYCDFNSFIKQNIDHLKWQQAYLKLLKKYQPLLQNKQIKSIFFGGGTPSLATPSMIKTIIDCIHNEIVQLPQDVEITLEANPTSVEMQKFEDFRTAGINRISLGIQSFNNKNLTFLGRNHDNKEALLALEVLRQTFNNYSFDLIYALPDQSMQSWQEELLSAIALAQDHLSLYQLTIEDNTKFGSLKRANLLAEIDEELASLMFQETQLLMEKKGFIQYEVSNFAKPGKESQHNLNYWLYGDYLGIGPGAHSRMTINEHKIATHSIKNPDVWLNKVQFEQEENDFEEILTEEAIRLEKILMGMRTHYGISKSLIKVDYSELLNDGLINIKDDKIIATNKGFLFLNTVITQLSS